MPECRPSLAQSVFTRHLGRWRTCVSGSSSRWGCSASTGLASSFRLPASIASRWASSSTSQDNTLFGLYDMFSGGALNQFSVFVLGIMPYITASIIMQLMVEMVPVSGAHQERGPAGPEPDHPVHPLHDHRHLPRPVLLAWPSGWSRCADRHRRCRHRARGGASACLTMLTMTGGACFVMWLGEQMTERGIGNGASIIITAGIIAATPAGAMQLFQLINLGAMNLLQACLLLVFMFAVDHGHRASSSAVSGASPSNTPSVCSVGACTRGRSPLPAPQGQHRPASSRRSSRPPCSCSPARSASSTSSPWLQWLTARVLPRVAGSTTWSTRAWSSSSPSSTRRSPSRPSRRRREPEEAGWLHPARFALAPRPSTTSTGC